MMDPPPGQEDSNIVMGFPSPPGVQGGMNGTLARVHTLGDLLFVFDIDPRSQPLFHGVILLSAVSLGSFRLLKVKKRVDLYQ